MGKLSALTNLQQLEAEPLIKVTPKLPWKPPAEAGGDAGDSAPAGPRAAAGSTDNTNTGGGGEEEEEVDEAAEEASRHVASAPQAEEPPALPPGVVLHELLAQVAASEALQRHAAALIKAHKSSFWVKARDPGW